MSLRSLVMAAVLAVAIGSPQLIAYSEIASEVERSAGFSAATVLRTSLTPMRVAEIFVWPFAGFLNDAGGDRVRLFSTLFLGLIGLRALMRRSRYTAFAIVMLLLAVGQWNPLVRWLVEELPAMRIMRFPEKFALPLTVALAVLVARVIDDSRFRKGWMIVTIVPLLWSGWRALPVDWFHYYRVEPLHPRRVHLPPSGSSELPARLEYRERARRLEPLFGATAGLSYGIIRSPDGMHSLLSRLVAERFAVADPALSARYLRLAGCDVPGGVPEVTSHSQVFVARDLPTAVRAIEAAGFDERTMVVAPYQPDGLGAHAPAQLRMRRVGQRLEIEIEPQPHDLLLLVNQTYFRSWVARAGGRELETLPLNIDRLGVVVPRGVTAVELEFGRRRVLVTAAWLASLLLLVLLPLVEKRQRLASEVERAADEDPARP